MLALGPGTALAHAVAEGDKGYIQEISGVHLMPFIYLGAKHMVTGYDHLLFLVGVIFFLYRLKDVALYVSLFTIGPSPRCCCGVLFGIGVNPLPDRRHHRPVGRLQGARQHGRVPALVRLPAEHEARRR